MDPPRSVNPPAVLLQVGNMKKDTVALWQKDGHEIKTDQQLSFSEGVLKLEIAQVSSATKPPEVASSVWPNVINIVIERC